MALLALVRPGLIPAPTYVLPRCVAAEAQTTCTCGGLLGYVLFAWYHVDVCLDCLAGPRNGCRHDIDCPDPEPVRCTHEADWRCPDPAALLERCAYGRADQTCCGCCWVRWYGDGQ